MRFYSDSRNNTPLRYVGRWPVYASTILAALYVAGMFATVVLNTVRGPLDLFTFSTEDFFLHFYLWQIFTCTFVNGPDFFFPFAIIFFYMFSVELEQYFGRRTYFTFYGLLLASIVAIHGVWRLAGYSAAYAGLNDIVIGLFVGYATLYPNLECFGWVPMKYMAFACIFIDAMNFLSGPMGPNWHGLSILLGLCGASFAFIRHAKLGGTVELGEWAGKLNPFRRRPKLRVMPSPERPLQRATTGPHDVFAVDAILDKIARDGFASLTQEERDQLERARDILNKKKN